VPYAISQQILIVFCIWPFSDFRKISNP